MEEWMDGSKDGWVDGSVDREKNRCVKRRMDRRRNGKVDGGQMEELMEDHILQWFQPCVHEYRVLNSNLS